MPELKHDHPPLYRRVRKKFIVHVLLGLVLIFASPKYTPNAQGTVMEHFADLHAHGIIFILIGLLIAVGLYYRRKNYQLVRIAMSAALGYSLMWWIALVLKIIDQPGSLAIVVLWGYWVSNLYEIATDSSWNIVEVIKEVQNNGDRTE